MSFKGRAVGLALAVLLMTTAPGMRAAAAADVQWASEQAPASLYDLQTWSLEGEPVDLGRYRGQVALVVNTASKCGLTPQYEGLEALYRDLAPRGFVVLGFPANDFKEQEPGTAAEIREFCTLKFDVTFPLFAKTTVKGEQKSEIYRLLCAELAEPTWNFTKYLVDKHGRVLVRFGPRTAPDDQALRDAILQALAAE